MSQAASPLTTGSSVRGYTLALVALLVLTAATVAAGLLSLSPNLHLLVAFTIAFVKAGVVAAVFMHLWHATPLERIFAVGALLWLAILVGFVLLDLASGEFVPAP